MSRRAVFLDRDGTLIYDRGYLADPAGVELLPDTLAALRLLRARGLALVLVTNQSGVGRGMFSHGAVAAVHRRLAELLAAQAIVLDGVYYCPHAPWDGCDCRKPRPGMLLRAARDLDLDLERSFMAGDKLDDVAAGRRAGCRTALLSSPTPASAERVAPDFVAPDLLSAAEWIARSADTVSAEAYRAPS